MKGPAIIQWKISATIGKKSDEITKHLCSFFGPKIWILIGSSCSVKNPYMWFLNRRYQTSGAYKKASNHLWNNSHYDWQEIRPQKLTPIYVIHFLLKQCSSDMEKTKHLSPQSSKGSKNEINMIEKQIWYHIFFIKT